MCHSTVQQENALISRAKRLVSTIFSFTKEVLRRASLDQAHLSRFFFPDCPFKAAWFFGAPYFFNQHWDDNPDRELGKIPRFLSLSPEVGKFAVQSSISVQLTEPSKAQVGLVQVHRISPRCSNCAVRLIYVSAVGAGMMQVVALALQYCWDCLVSWSQASQP